MHFKTEMDTTMAQQRNQRLLSVTSTTSSNSSNGDNNSNLSQGASGPIMHSQSPPPASLSASSSSFANLLDGFTSRVSGERQSQSAASTSSSSSNSLGMGVPGVSGIGNGSSGVGLGLGTSGSIASLTSIGSTANAFYSSIGLAFNSLTSPITAAAAAASATTAEAAAVVVAAASAISNHLSSPTSTTPPHGELDDDDEDCDDDDDEEDDDADDGHVPAPTPKKSWSEIKATVNEIRKQLSNLSSMVPSNIQFRTLSDGRVRCYFLSTPPNAWETTLLYTDINISSNPAVSATSASPGIENDLILPESPTRNIRMSSPPRSLSQTSSPVMPTGFLGSFNRINNRFVNIY